MNKPLRSSNDIWIEPAAKPWVPHFYQEDAIRFLLSQGGAGLFLQPGLGKSSVTLAAVKILLAKKLIRSALIIAPLRVCYTVWPREIEKWEEFNGLTYQILHGPKKDLAAKQKADIYLLNPDGLEWFLKEKRTNCDVLVCDESTIFKNSQSKRSKLLRASLNRFKRRIILTGTPAPNGYLDLFFQMFILDGGAALGRYITHYRNQFFFQSGYGGYEWKLLPGMAEQIEERIAPLVMQLSAEDYLKMPELVRNVVQIDLPTRVMKQYRDLEEEFLIELDGGKTVTAATAAVASMKLRQLCSGAIYHDTEDGSRKWQEVHTAKLDALKELVDELSGQPVLILYEFTHDLDRLLRMFGEDTPYLGGGVSPKRTQEIEAEWNRGEIPILIGNSKSMGHGMNLQEGGSAVIWLNPSWDLELALQTLARVYRQGQKSKTVIVHHILARNTLDETVYRTLHAKDKKQVKLLDALKAYGKQRAHSAR